MEVVGGGRYAVHLDERGPVEATLRGRLKRGEVVGGRIVVGDRVSVAASEDAWVIQERAARSSALVRRGTRDRRPRPVVANLERALVVMAAAEPDLSTDLLDRFLVVAEAGGMAACIIINKVDLAGDVAKEIRRVYAPPGYPVLEVSARTRRGLDALAEVVCAGTSALVGPSGVGKSTLLNALDPSLDLRIGDLSRRTGRGRHTTVSARLIHLSCGGLVADTPGFGDVGLWGVGPQDLPACFPEIRRRSEGCRFRGCSHLHEPGCDVVAAVQAGEIDAGRYGSYVRLRQEAEEAAQP